LSVNESQNGKLTAKQERAIKALLSEPTTKDAAVEAKVSEATLRRWLKDAAFSASYREARNQLLETTLTWLQQASGEAVDTLKEVMADKMAKGSERVSAAKAVLEMALKARDVLEVEERLAALEAKFDAQQKGGRKQR
jgi:hypothetical protein